MAPAIGSRASRHWVHLRQVRVARTRLAPTGPRRAAGTVELAFGATQRQMRRWAGSRLPSIGAEMHESGELNRTAVADTKRMGTPSDTTTRLQDMAILEHCDPFTFVLTILAAVRPTAEHTGRRRDPVSTWSLESEAGGAAARPASPAQTASAGHKGR